MDILLQTVMLATGLAVLMAAAEAFVAKSGRLATAFRISPMAIGLTLVAFGTSLPELAVSLNATLEGSPGLAVGNVIGSNLANTLLILGLAAAVMALPVSRDSVMRDGAWWIAATVAFLLAAYSGAIGRFEGVALLVGLALYLFSALRSGVDFEEELDATEETAATARLWAVLALSVAAIWAGSEMAVYGAVGLAESLGTDETIVGLTVVAFGTSLPELATVIACLRRGETEMLIGGIVGSNIFNIFAILGVTAVVATLPVDRTFISFDLPVLMVVSAMALIVLRTGWVVSRWEGAALLGGYVAYIGATSLAAL